jgi:hypothetical protein
MIPRQDAYTLKAGATFTMGGSTWRVAKVRRPWVYLRKRVRGKLWGDVSPWNIHDLDSLLLREWQHKLPAMRAAKWKEEHLDGKKLQLGPPLCRR